MITSILAFVLAFGLLVIIHEFGHFWVAKKAGVCVETFSIGFGPKLFTFRRNNTDFCISLIPLGGYVKMKGEGDESDIDPNDNTAFSNKSVKARSAVVVAGPVMNLILSFVLMPIVFWIGKGEPAYYGQPPVVERVLLGTPAEESGIRAGDKILNVAGQSTPDWKSVIRATWNLQEDKVPTVTVERLGREKEFVLKKRSIFPRLGGGFLGFEKYFGEAPPAEITQVLPDSPAFKAGLQKGDLVKEINGKPIRSWEELIQFLGNSKGESLSLALERGKKITVVELQPEYNEESQRWLMGIQGPSDTGVNLLGVMLSANDYTLWEGFKNGIALNYQHLIMTFGVLKMIFSGEASYKQLGGPVAIATTLADAAAEGVPDFLFFTAFLSLQLAILNILPVPVLDGGHLVFFGIEAIRRKPIALKARLIATQIGMILLLSLVLIVTWNDIRRILGV